MFDSPVWCFPTWKHNNIELPLYQEHRIPQPLLHQHPWMKGHCTKLLEAGCRIMDIALFNRVYVGFSTYTICFPEDYPPETTNDRFCWALQRFIEYNAQYGILYVWVREKQKGTHHHYHLGLWVDYRQIKSMSALGEGFDMFWSSALELLYTPTGLVHYGDADRRKVLIRPGEMIEEDYKRMFLLYSYLSKVYTKEYPNTSGSKRWEFTRIREGHLF